MGVTTGDYEESVALEPWDYGGPEHVHHAPHVAIVDADGVLVDAEDGLGEPFALGEPIPAAVVGHPAWLVEHVTISSHGPLRALLVHPPTKPAAAATIRLRALGTTEIEGDEACWRWLGQRTGGLLKFLVCRRYRVVHAQDIAEALWGHGGFVSSGTVRQCVHDTREKLDAGCPGAGALVITRQSGYALHPGALVDADDFAVHVRRGIGALGRGRQAIAIVHLRRAVAMYRGDFLADEPRAVWAQAERDRLREHMEDALLALAELYLMAGEAGAAISCLRRLGGMRPLDADVQRHLLTVLLDQGRLSHATRCYEAFCARLEGAFQCPPGFTLAELHA